MVRLRRGKVTQVGEARPGVIELQVDVDGGPARALAYPDLTGPVKQGDTVVLNTTAVALGLGTGGFHFVMAVEGAEPSQVEADGRVMKARYTPVQTAVTSVEETHKDLLEASSGLDGTPVIVAPLHSEIAHAASGARVAGAERVVYVMTDGASLAGALSHLVPRLRDAGILDGFVTSGQAFGGELEAATVWSGLLAAKEIMNADVIVMADGPGALGTDTTWGASPLTSGHSLNAAGTLGGRPVAVLRVSFADERERHHGVSHHSITVLADVCLVEANVAVPTLEAPERHEVWAALRAAELEKKHKLVEVLGFPAIHALEEAGVEVTSMGRGPEEDPIFFLAAGGAGILAGRMASGKAAWKPTG